MNDIIFTNHVKSRMSERKISEKQVLETIRHCDKMTKNGNFIKKFENQTLTATTKLDGKNYVVLSAWIDPPNPGTKDEKKNRRYNEMKRSSMFRRFYLTFLNQLGM